ncbi:MAG TPA: hypothetical protein VIE16_02745 [Phenylobacterium sp.]|jgi:hypothetical protein
MYLNSNRARPLLAALAAVLGFCAAGVSAQPYQAPRNAYGAPDFNGEWNNNSLTRLERPPGTGPLVVSDSDAAATERRLAASYAPDATVGNVGGTQSEWWDGAHLGRVDGQLRTSWIVDPVDGRLPYTAEGQRLVMAAGKATRDAMDNPEQRPLAERCLLPSWGAMAPLMLNSPYNANYRFLQTRDELVILSENNDELRVIRIGAAHLPPQLNSWTGDSIGRWDKDTLMVETTNLRGAPFNTPPFLINARSKVLERFTRVSPTTLKYQFTVVDPVVFDRPWWADMTFTATNAAMYEFACHEGNYGMTNILAGARAIERETASAPASR